MRDIDMRRIIGLTGMDASIRVGGNGHGGKVLLQNADRNSITLDRDTGDITLYDRSGYIRSACMINWRSRWTMDWSW